MKKDIPFLYWLRAFAILFVVILHCRLNEMSGIVALGWGTLNTFTITCVPLFVMISGSLLMNRGENLKTFYRKRLPKLLVPLVVWGGYIPCYRTY